MANGILEAVSRLDSLLHNTDGSSANHSEIFESFAEVCSLWWEGDAACESAPQLRALFVKGHGKIIDHVASGSLKLDEDQEKLLSQRAPIVLVQMTAQLILTGNRSTILSDPPVSPLAICSADVAFLREVMDVPFMSFLKPDLLAALQQPAEPSGPPHRQPEQFESHDSISEHGELLAQLQGFAKYFEKAPFMKHESPLAIRLAILESHFYTLMLKDMRDDIFPPTNSKKRNEYLMYIPPMFLFESTAFENCCPPKWLFDIIVWSMFIFLVDEHMEHTVATFSQQERDSLKAAIEQIHPVKWQQDTDDGGAILRCFSAAAATESTTDRACKSIDIFRHWVNWVLQWDSLALAVPLDILDFRFEIKRYLLAHIRQIDANAKFAKQFGREVSVRYPNSNPVCFAGQDISFPSWVRHVASVHISAPISIAMAACYMGSWVRKGRSGWSSVMQGMLASNANAHVAAYCRLFNDYGSGIRDAEESNLNSINFAEFWQAGKPQEGDVEAQFAHAKAQLLDIAYLERELADVLLKRLFASLEGEGSLEGRRIASAMRIYFRSGELFSDMYVTKDVTNTVT